MKQKYWLAFAFLSILLLGGFSCKKEDSIPAYIHIDGFTLLANPSGFPVNSETGNEGSLSQKITDAWFYVDDQLVGCFELPATFPVLAEGVHHVMIKPGIKINGIAATRAPYPFFKTYEQDVDFKAATKTTLSPTTMYESFSHFAFMENFENTGIIIDSSTSSQSAIHYVSSPPAEVFEGGNSGMATVKGGQVYFECNSQLAYSLPKDGSPIFLEMNYKSDRSFVIGTMGQPPFYSKDFLINVHATDTWNKAYFYLSPNINSASATTFKIFFYMDVTAGDSAAISFDNFKIVY